MDVQVVLQVDEEELTAELLGRTLDLPVPRGQKVKVMLRFKGPVMERKARCLEELGWSGKEERIEMRSEELRHDARLSKISGSGQPLGWVGRTEFGETVPLTKWEAEQGKWQRKARRNYWSVLRELVGMGVDEWWIWMKDRRQR